MNEQESKPERRERLLRQALEMQDEQRARRASDLWTSSLLPVESLRDFIKAIVQENGLPELATIAVIELEGLAAQGTSWDQFLELATNRWIDIERRIDLEERFQKATVDPLSKSPSAIAMMVAAIRGENPNADASIGKYVSEWIRSGDHRSLKALAKLTETPEQVHRVQRMLRILLEFHENHGRFPTKAEARKVVIEREKAETRNPSLERWAHQFPEARATKEWNVIWDQCGVPWLELGNPGRPRKK